jgi:hypothetical protein
VGAAGFAEGEVDAAIVADGAPTMDEALAAGTDAVPLDVFEQPATAEIASTSAPERDEGLMTAPLATRRG